LLEGWRKSHALQRHVLSGHLIGDQMAWSGRPGAEGPGGRSAPWRGGLPKPRPDFVARRRSRFSEFGLPYSSGLVAMPEGRRRWWTANGSGWRRAVGIGPATGRGSAMARRTVVAVTMEGGV
jgi:hypothetical protein